jgi:hypothetical protein
MKTFVAAAVTMAMLAGSAHAQKDKMDRQDPLTLKYEKERKDREDTEKEYDATMRRTRSQGSAPKADPWAGVRPADNASTKR